MPRRCRSLEHPKLTEFAFTVMVKAVERKQCNCLACTETPTVIRTQGDGIGDSGEHLGQAGAVVDRVS